MHPQFQRAHELTKEVIGACIEVHRILGPGLIESVYERCLQRELEIRGLVVQQQQVVRIDYKGYVFEEVLKYDLLESCRNHYAHPQSKVNELHEDPQRSARFAGQFS